LISAKRRLADEVSWGDVLHSRLADEMTTMFAEDPKRWTGFGASSLDQYNRDLGYAISKCVQEAEAR